MDDMINPISMLLGFTVIALVAGYVANMLVGKGKGFEAWEFFVAGIVGSFVGGTILNLLVEGELNVSPIGLIGSIGGAIIGFGLVTMGSDAIAWGKVGQIAASWLTSPGRGRRAARSGPWNPSGIPIAASRRRTDRVTRRSFRS